MWLLIIRSPPSPQARIAVATRGGGLVDLSIVATVATMGGGGLVDSLVNSSDDKISVESAPLFGVGVLNDSPTFSEHNDLMPDSPTDNKVSKYSSYSRVSHCLEGHKISMLNWAAVKLCLLSEAGAFWCNMDPIKKDKKERAFLLSISPTLMKLRMSSSRMKSLSVRLRNIIMRRVCGGNTKQS